MADKIVVVPQHSLKPIKIVKWKVNEGNSISIGCVLLLYKLDGDNSKESSKLKSTKAGTVHRIVAQEGDVVNAGENLLELKACIHPTVMKDMCAECGADLRKDDLETTASVPMIHTVPELKVSLELAQKLGKADSDRLLKDRKLVLLVDLDQTLIHTTNDNIPPNIKDVYHFQLYGPNSPWYHTRLRPGTHKFLTQMASLYELHICTFGARNYAHMIAMFLDQDGKLFSHRILSRDECFNSNSKTANLKALFPCGDNMVCIIDDREDVWSYASNLIHVKPYHFFQHTGDINAPPGLDKHEDDDKEGVDLTKVQQRTTLNGNNEYAQEDKTITEHNADKKEDENTENKMSDLQIDNQTKKGEDKNTSMEEQNTSCLQSEENEEKLKKDEVKTNEKSASSLEHTLKSEENKEENKVVKTDILKQMNKSDEGVLEVKKKEESHAMETVSLKQIKQAEENKEETKKKDSLLMKKFEESINEDLKEMKKSEVKNALIENQEINTDGQNILSLKQTNKCRESEETIEDVNQAVTYGSKEKSEENEAKKCEETMEVQESKEELIESLIGAENSDNKNTQEIKCEENESKFDETTEVRESTKEPKEGVEKEKKISEEIMEVEESTKDLKKAELINTQNENQKTLPVEEKMETEENPEKTPEPKLNNGSMENDTEDSASEPTSKSDELIEIEDPDDYLLYLEEILTLIHRAFYDKYDKMESGGVPDLKKVIPEVRGDVLKGTKLVFSGLVPTHVKLDQSKAYQVARSLGAVVTQDLVTDSTHLVAVRPGTAKVNVGRRKKSLKIVTPDWLWACAERWERVDEQLFQLSTRGSKNRHPPPHCSSPEHAANFEQGDTRKRTPSGRFMDTINPLMSFSSADIADMDREVEDIFNESESESEVKKPPSAELDPTIPVPFKPKDSDEDSSSSDESLTGEHPHGWNPDTIARKRSRSEQEQDNEDESTADEFPSTKFRRGEELPSDLEFGQESNSDGSLDAPDEIDDGEWNMMGAALEREFLSNN